MSKPVRYDLERAKIKRARVGKTEIKSFSMREVDGRDEEVATNSAKARGGSATTQEELVRLSVVAVNDVNVEHPYLAFDTWNSRARSFSLKAFNELNGMSKEEEADFLATAEEKDATPPSSLASASAID